MFYVLGSKLGCLFVNERKTFDLRYFGFYFWMIREKRLAGRPGRP